MCQCQKNNCGCSEKVITYDLCNKCPSEACTCEVEITTNCITLAEDLPCSGVSAGSNFTEALQQIDEFICDAVAQIGQPTNLVNVGSGSQIYKGVDGVGRREIRTITSSDNSATVTQNEDTINITVPEVDQNNFVRQILINTANLPQNYTKQDIANYILTLPANSRTIEDTDSKWNVIIFESAS